MCYVCFHTCSIIFQSGGSEGMIPGFAGMSVYRRVELVQDRMAGVEADVVRWAAGVVAGVAGGEDYRQTLGSQDIDIVWGDSDDGAVFLVEGGDAKEVSVYGVEERGGRDRTI